MEYKGFLIESDGTFGHKVIKPIGRGSVPAKLKGTFTTNVFAMKQIDQYEGEKKDGKAKSSK
jgi:hypothetical protein